MLVGVIDVGANTVRLNVSNGGEEVYRENPGSAPPGTVPKSSV